jgi:biopolymer transport protein ExbB
VIETIRSGGLIMVPLMACSVLALAVVLDRLWNLRRGKIISPEVIIQVNHWVGQGVVEEAIALCRRVKNPMTNVVMAALLSDPSSRTEIRMTVEDAGRQEAPFLEKNLNWLGICATVSPLIGLLGTVTGMIKVFRVLALEGPGNPYAMSAGISEALVTTATGLIVAIPALLFHGYFAGKVDSLLHEMEQYSLQLVSLLGEKKGKGPSRG